jgi:hypothetical protein
LKDMTAFQNRGWELVVSDVPPDAIQRLGPRIARAVELGPGRYTLELPLDPPPERLLGELTAAGAHLVSLNPIRDTLEDFFVQQVAGQPPEAAR